MMDWTPYIGIPFAWHGRELTGVDCYGLLILVYETLGIQLPDYEYGDGPNLAPLFTHGLALPGWQRQQAPAEFSAVLFSICGYPLHCGIMVDGTRFLHSRMGINSCIQRVNGLAWRNRVLGFYRYAAA